MQVIQGLKQHFEQNEGICLMWDDDQVGRFVFFVCGPEVKVA